MNRIKAAFFDRDGTIIEDVYYLNSTDKVKLIDKTLDLILYLQEQDYKIFVVTNQSGIARGYFDQNFVKRTHQYLDNLLVSKNIFIEKYFICPHHPIHASDKKYLIDCDCRKPKPGLLLSAAAQFNINLEESLMFGDKISDIKAGQSAGCKSFYIQEFLNISEDEKISFYKNIFERG